jgi:UDP-N-acetyl-D-glucosamine dehydrogenase
MRKHAIDLESVNLTPAALRRADAVVVVTHHRAIDWKRVAKHARLVVDTRNAMARVAGVCHARVVKA